MTSSGLLGDFTTRRCIIALDMDYFYCQVALRKRSDIDRNCPVGAFQRNLVVTCNYPARAAGVKKLMSVDAAYRVCPELILLDASDLKDFRIACSEIISLLKEILGGIAVENLGLDEFFIDVTEKVRDKGGLNPSETVLKGYCWPFEHCDSPNCLDSEECREFVVASHLCHEIRESINCNLHLTCSGGISCSKVLSKLAASLHKPNEQTVILPHDVPQYLSKLNLSELPGIGPVTYQSLLDRFSVSTCEQLRWLPIDRLSEAFGSRMAVRLFKLCRGMDEEPVHDTSLVKSISCEERFSNAKGQLDVEHYVGIVVERLLDRIVEHATVHSGRYPRTLVVTYLKTSGTKRETISCNVPFDLIRLCTLCNQVRLSSNDYCDKFSTLRNAVLIRLKHHCFNLLQDRLDSNISILVINVGVKNFVNPKGEEQSFCRNTIVSLLQDKSNSIDKENVSQSSSQEPMKCFICGALLNWEMSNENINRHIDKCLSMGTSEKESTKCGLDTFIKHKKRKVTLPYSP